MAILSIDHEFAKQISSEVITAEFVRLKARKANFYFNYN